MQTEYEFDVFISYAREDKAWVHGELLTRIKQAGLKPYIDIHDFKPGPPTINEMERGIQTSRKTILVLTPNYIDSDWCQLECDIVQSLDPVNRRSRLIPLLKERCNRPPHIAVLTYIKFTDDADLEVSWRQLLTALGKPPEPESPRLL